MACMWSQMTGNILDWVRNTRSLGMHPNCHVWKAFRTSVVRSMLVEMSWAYSAMFSILSKMLAVKNCCSMYLICNISKARQTTEDTCILEGISILSSDLMEGLPFLTVITPIC